MNINRHLNTKAEIERLCRLLFVQGVGDDLQFENADDMVHFRNNNHSIPVPTEGFAIVTDGITYVITDYFAGTVNIYKLRKSGIPNP